MALTLCLTLGGGPIFRGGWIIMVAAWVRLRVVRVMSVVPRDRGECCEEYAPGPLIISGAL
jgi:hypothetical protein